MAIQLPPQINLKDFWAKTTLLPRENVFYFAVGRNLGITVNVLEDLIYPSFLLSIYLSHFRIFMKFELLFAFGFHLLFTLKVL